MRILFFISTLENDGAERAMSNITTHLPDNVEADILLNSVSDHDFPTDANVISLGMPADKKKGTLYQIVALFKRIPKLYRLKKNNNYDACISFMDSANMCNILTGNKYCRTIISVRVSVAQDRTFIYKYVVRNMIKLLYNKADYIVAVAEGIRRELINNFDLCSEKVKTITNGYDVADIRKKSNMPMPDKLLTDMEGKFIYVTVGRFSDQKAQWHLIRAFSRVASECNNACLLVVGQGDDKEYLENIIKVNSLQDKVYLIPYQKNPFAVLKQCDVFVMPSMFEGYCNALCEALICGLPCIATDFQSSAREILAPDTDYSYRIKTGVEKAAYGILTPVCSGTRYKGNEPLEKNEEYLAEAMMCLNNDRELFDKYRKASAIRADELDIDTKVNEWIELADK